MKWIQASSVTAVKEKVPIMITGIHAMFYTSEPEELRAFIRDKLGLRWADAGQGWLIFEAPGAEIGCHPEAPEKSRPAGAHDISFYCKDVAAAVAELKSRGVEFTDEVTDQGFGLVTHFRMPGGVTAQLYEPRYRTEYR